MINVFLDDRRSAPQGFHLARTAEQCIRLLRSESIGILSLDYNLGSKAVTGYRVAKHMVRSRIYPGRIVIHSNSPKGRAKMYRLLKRHKPKNVPIFIRPLPSPRVTL